MHAYTPSRLQISTSDKTLGNVLWLVSALTLNLYPASLIDGRSLKE